MPVIAVDELFLEILALWLLWSGVAWIGLAAHRSRETGLDATAAVLAAAALAGWAVALRLFTPIFGVPEVVPLGLVPLVWSGVPVYAVALAIVVLAAVVALVARRSSVALGLVLLILVVVPGLGIPALAGDAEQVSLFSDPIPVTIADLPPPMPIVPPEHPGMIRVPEGPFIMGTLHPAQLRPIVGTPVGDEQPVRTVFLSSYLIDRHEVTNGEFTAFVESSGHVTEAESRGWGQIWRVDGWYRQEGATWRNPMGPQDSIVGLEDHPVVQVSWNDASAYCSWAGKRLPTEAEWEKAARGIDARDYPWGNSFDASKLNYCDAECTQLSHFNDTTASDGWARTAPVGTYPEGMSPYGAYDMVGNVWEWVSDWYDAEYYTYAPDVDPPGPEHSSGIGAEEHRVVRGGSWTSERDFVRTTSRSYDPPTYTYFGVGFRCAMDDTR